MKTFRNAFRIYLGGTYAKKNYNKNYILSDIVYISNSCHNYKIEFG